jgi:malonyl-CoA decarboxylase
VPNFARWLARQNIQDGPDMQPAEAFLTAHPEEVRALAAYYVLQAKRENDMPVDPVARFHLGNGASLYQIHEGADLSPRGQKQSYGLMVNYLYEREKLIENHEKFVKDGDIKAQPKLHELARKYKDKLSEKS